MGAVAQQQRADNIVRYSRNDAADCRDEQSSAEVARKRQPKRRRHPYQRGAYDRNQGEESNYHTPENRRADSRKRKGQSAKRALNGRDQQSYRDAGEYEFFRFAHHVFLDGCVKRQEMAHGAGNVLAVAKNEKIFFTRPPTLAAKNPPAFAAPVLAVAAKSTSCKESGKCRFTQSRICVGTTVLSGDCRTTCALAPASIACLAV